MKKLYSIKILLFFLLLLGVNNSAFAERINIALKNSTYTIKSLCNMPHQPGFRNGDYICNKEYVIEFTNKNNIFENYTFLNERIDGKTIRNPIGVTLQTDLYDINVEASRINKSRINIYLTESDLEKIFESDRVQINFILSLFIKGNAQNTIDKTRSVVLNLSGISIDTLKSSCSTEYPQCLSEVRTLNSPVNRLKRYFQE